MNGREFWALRELSNDELEASLNGLLGAGARVEARIVAHLAEVEARRLHLLAGCSSLYDYCRRRLGLSDYEAFVRIAAARVARRYSVVFGMLERRELHLTAICEVREFLTAENHRELLDAVSGKTKLQIREVLARRFPQADVPTSLKRLPALEPLSPERYRLLLTLNTEQKEKLELARDLLSHANPSGDLAVVVERALDELISRLEKRRFGRTHPRRPRDRTDATSPTSPTSPMSPTSPTSPMIAKVQDVRKHDAQMPDVQMPDVQAHPAKVPAEQRCRKHLGREVRRQVLDRDGPSCAFISDDGERCDARAFLQFHHRHAWARGGADTADNLELLCHAHNRLFAEQEFGETYIEAVVSERNAAGQSSGT